MTNKELYLRKINTNPHLTDFRKKVLRVVLDIPQGEVRSYTQIAKKIKSPKAARAVGRALGANPYAPYVPCHRVIASDGSIGGYSGGTKEKQKLLKSEGVEIATS